jgi:hypothetical protein
LVSEKVICIVYVDETLLFSPQSEYFNEILAKLKEDYDDAAGFLGIHVQQDNKNGQIYMSHVGLIDRIINALGCDTLPGKRTPAEYEALGSDREGDPPQGTFFDPSVIGMLQYLQAHTKPATVTHQCPFSQHMNLMGWV